MTRTAPNSLLHVVDENGSRAQRCTCPAESFSNRPSAQSQLGCVPSGPNSSLSLSLSSFNGRRGMRARPHRTKPYASEYLARHGIVNRPFPLSHIPSAADQTNKLRPSHKRVGNHGYSICSDADHGRQGSSSESTVHHIGGHEDTTVHSGVFIGG